MATTAPTAPPPRTPDQPGLRSVPGPAPATFRDRAAHAGLRLDRPLAAAGLEVDVAAYTVTRDGEQLDLSPRQVELLALFLAEPRRVWSRDQLHWLCWGDTAPSRRVDVQLCRLRARTGSDLFRNVRDRGWALRTPV